MTVEKMPLRRAPLRMSEADREAKRRAIQQASERAKQRMEGLGGGVTAL